MWTKCSWVCQRLSGACVSPCGTQGCTPSGGDDSIGIDASPTGRAVATHAHSWVHRGPAGPIEGRLVGSAH